MRISARQQNKHIPSFMELEMMLKKLKLSQIMQKSQTLQRFNTEVARSQQEHTPIINPKEYASIVFDNLQNPHCFEEQIEAIDIKSLNRNIQKKSMIKLTSQQQTDLKRNQENNYANKPSKNQENLSNPTQLLQKFKDHIEKVNRSSNVKIDLSSQKFKRAKSTIRLHLYQQIDNSNKQNKNTMINQQKNRKNQQNLIKKMFTSRIQIHKFSDCQQLLREAGKK